MAKKTGVQENRGYTQTDDFITRTHVLPLLTDKKKKVKKVTNIFLICFIGLLLFFKYCKKNN